MDIGEVRPLDPVALASNRAETTIEPSFDMSETDSRLLAELDHGAQLLDFLGKNYFVESHCGFIVPASFEADEPVTYTRFLGINFEGDFVSYSKVHIGQIIGAGAIRAVCLTFNRAFLLSPSLAQLEDDSLLHIPVLAVSNIAELS